MIRSGVLCQDYTKWKEIIRQLEKGAALHLNFINFLSAWQSPWILHGKRQRLLLVSTGYCCSKTNLHNPHHVEKQSPCSNCPRYALTKENTWLPAVFSIWVDRLLLCSSGFLAQLRSSPAGPSSGIPQGWEERDKGIGNGWLDRLMQSKKKYGEATILFFNRITKVTLESFAGLQLVLC